MTDTKLIAKPILKDQFWVITDGEKKVGNITSNGSGLDVRLNDTVVTFNNKNEIKKNVRIGFAPVIKTNNVRPNIPYPQYPTVGRVYNSIYDVQRGLHLYTKQKKSKCYYAAGWFSINQSDSPETILCPKFIFIQRYPFVGPFKTKQELDQELNSQ